MIGNVERVVRALNNLILNINRLAGLLLVIQKPFCTHGHSRA